MSGDNNTDIAFSLFFVVLLFIALMLCCSHGDCKKQSIYKNKEFVVHLSEEPTNRTDEFVVQLSEEPTSPPKLVRQHAIYLPYSPKHDREASRPLPDSGFGYGTSKELTKEIKKSTKLWSFV